MKPIDRRFVSLACVLLAGSVASIASCAKNESVGVIDDDASSPLPEASAVPIDDAGVDEVEAGCDASDADCTSELVSCDDVSWCLVANPVSTAHALTSVWGSSKDDVWAVGSGGTILHYDGQTWTKLPQDYPNTFVSVWGSAKEDVWIASTSSLVLHSRAFEGGAAVWENVAPSVQSTAPNAVGGKPVTAIWAASPTEIRMGTRAFYASVATPDYSFYFSGTVNRFVSERSVDGGLFWRALPGREQVITAIWGSSADDVWMAIDNSARVAHERGLLVHGRPYTGPRPNPNTVSRGDYCSDCEQGCVLCAMIDDPLIFSPIDSQSNVALHAIWGSSANDVWAVGDQGTIRRNRAGDARWEVIESPTTETLHAVCGSGPDDVWFAGNAGTVLHFDGTSVVRSTVQLPLGAKPNLRGIWGSGPNDVWIVGDAVTLHYTGPKPGASGGG